MLFKDPNNYLRDEETILNSLKIHWWIFVTPALLLLALIYCWIKSLIQTPFSVLYFVDFREYHEHSNIVLHYLSIASKFIFDGLPESVTNYLSNIKIHPWKWITTLLFFYTIYKIIRALLTYFSTQITITDERIIVENGILKYDFIDLSKMQIDACHFKQNFISRFFNVGTLIIQASSGLVVKVPAINVDEFMASEALEYDA